MGKILGSVAFLIAIVVGGYFYDAGFHAKVAGMFHKGETAAVASGSDWARATAPAETISTNSSGALADIISKGVVHVSVQNPSKPFYSNEGSRPKGFNVDF